MKSILPSMTLSIILVSMLPNAQSQEKTGKPWLDMNYGPYLSAAIEVTPENFAYKGIAIPLSKNWGGKNGESVLFDTNLLRYSAGWQDGFIEMNGIVFDGKHGVYPKIDGDPLWVTKPIPGWGKFGVFDDPRGYIYDHLPEYWGRWNGLYLHGQNVILSYEISGTQILDMPSLTYHNDLTAFTRTIHLEPREIEHRVEILFEEHSPAEFRSLNSLQPATDETTQSLVMFQQDSSTILAVGAKGAPDGSRWLTKDGHLRLQIPPSGNETHVNIYLWSGEKAHAPEFAALIQKSKTAPSLTQFTQGGPPRWDQTISTQGAPLQYTSKADQITAPPSDTEQHIHIAEIEESEAVLLTKSSLSPVDFPASVEDTFLVNASAQQDQKSIQFKLDQLKEHRIGYWPFDEGSGNTAMMQEGIAGDIQLEDTRWRRGVVGRSLEFEGTGHAIVENDDAIDLRNTDLTFTCWINTEYDGTILSKTLLHNEWVPGGITLFVRDGHVTFDMGWVGSVASTARRVDDGKWHHVTLIWLHQAKSAVIYVDGKHAVGGEFIPESEWNLEDFTLQLGYTAENFPSETHFSGKIDELRIFNKELTIDEIQTLIAAADVRLADMIGIAGTNSNIQWVQNGNEVALQIPASGQTQSVNVWKQQGFYSGINDFAADLSLLESELNQQNQVFPIMEVTDPEQNPWDSWMRFGGFDFFSDGSSAAICTWSGDVWIVRGIDDDMDSLTWQRIATGLHQPLGLKIVADEIYVIDRNQLTKLHDLNGDDETDFYENFNNDIMNSEHFHEPCMELQTDTDGNFYTMKGAQHGLPALHPHHGTLVKISNDGKDSKVIARGFRASNGVCLDSDGVFYGTDQEGYWMPANKITRVQPGQFHGNQWAWIQGIRVDTFVPPVCWIHPAIDRSPSSFVVAEEDWGILEDHLISLSYGQGAPFLVLQENVDGMTQGAVTPLPMEFPTGIMRGRFHPRDGSLYVCGLFGWSADNQYPGGFYRVRMNKDALNVPNGFHAVQDGIVISFTTPLNEIRSQTVSNYEARAWNYEWSVKYGSPNFDLNGNEGVTRWDIEQVTLSQDRKSVFLSIPAIESAMQVQVDFDINTNDGTAISSYVHGTIHKPAAIHGKDFLNTRGIKE